MVKQLLFLAISLSAACPLAHGQNSAAVKGSIFQDFENSDDFSLVFSPWNVIDIDGSTTYGIENVSFPHMNEPMAYLVFNPGQTVPSQLEDQQLAAHSGYKYAACFASQVHQNNDWIISPLVELGSNGELKFWVKSYTSQFGLERYRVGVSTTSPDPANFTIISPGSYLEAPAAAWEQKVFDLSAYNGMDIFVGIQCVSVYAFIFMLDDIEITSLSTVTSTLTGNVTDASSMNPIEDVLVSVAGQSDLTDELGNYSINNIQYGSLDAAFSASVTVGGAPLSVQFTDLSTEGNQVVTASADGYFNYVSYGVSIPFGGSSEFNIALTPAKNPDPDKTMPQERNIISWSWDFGDGGKSTVQNPVHVYNNNGIYTVSLVISDGFNTSKETMNSYIVVGPNGLNDDGLEANVKVFPNPAVDELHVNSLVKAKSMSLVNLNGVEMIREKDCGNPTILDIRNIPGGIYLLRIITEKGVIHQKINVLK